MKPLGEIVEREAAVTNQTQSPIEKLMMLAFLRNKLFTIATAQDEIAGEGYFVIPQYDFGPYRADFMIIVNGYRKKVRKWPTDIQVKVAVECDGHEFHTLPEQIENDLKRDQYFKSKGVHTLRYTGTEIYNYGDILTDKVASFISDRIVGLYEV